MTYVTDLSMSMVQVYFSLAIYRLWYFLFLYLNFISTGDCTIWEPISLLRRRTKKEFLGKYLQTRKFWNVAFTPLNWMYAWYEIEFKIVVLNLIWLLVLYIVPLFILAQLFILKWNGWFGLIIIFWFFHCDIIILAHQ